MLNLMVQLYLIRQGIINTMRFFYKNRYLKLDHEEK